MPSFKENDLSTYTVKQLRDLNSREKLHIGSTSNMTKKDLVENIKLTNYWQDKIKGGNSEEPSVLTEMTPKKESIEIKPLVVEPPKVEMVVEKPVEKVAEKVSEKITTTVSKDSDGNTVIVLVIKPL